MSELYELPADWKWQEWKNIVNVKNGKHYKDVLNPNGKYPIYGSGGIINYADEYLCNENTTIIGRKGTINNPIFAEEKFWNIDTAFGLEANQEYLVPLFLYYFSIHFNFLTLNKSTTLPSLAKSNLQKILIPLPPLQKQKQIVAKLDMLFAKIDQAITLHQQNIDEADKFMGSVLNEVFGELEEKYEKVPLFSVANVARGKSKHRPRNDKKLFGGKYPFVQTGDVRNADKYIDSYTSTYNEFGLQQSKLWDKGTICMTIAANIGDVAILEIDACFPDSVVGIYSNKNSNDFIFYFLLTLKQQLESQATTTAQMNINLKVLQTIGVPLPPLQIQQKTVTYLDKLSQKTQQLKKIQQEKLQSLKALKASILDKAFRGEL